MYEKIMVPVDLAHTDKLDRALAAAADLSRLWGAPVVAVGVTGAAFSSVARTPEEFSMKLQRYAAEQSERLGIEIAARTAVTPDPVRDLDDALREHAHEIGADLVVMASHVPGWTDYVFHSNAGWLASHSDLSVFVVR